MTATQQATKAAGPPPADQVVRAGTVFAVPVGLLHVGRNPRKDVGDISDLVSSIRDVGVLTPLVATRDPSKGLTLVFGQRRLAAAKAAGLTHVPTLLMGDMRDAHRLRLAAIENMHRLRMEPLDEARMCAELLGFGLTKDKIAQQLARSVGWVDQRLSLLELPVEVQRQVRDKTMPLGKATDYARQLRRTGQASVVVGPRCKPHFTTGHTLSHSAAARCNHARHPTDGRLGPACGPCWETAIRDDVLGNELGAEVHAAAGAHGKVPDVDQLAVEQFLDNHDVTLNRAERNQVVLRLHEHGLSDQAIADRVGGISIHAVLKIRQRTHRVEADLAVVA